MGTSASNTGPSDKTPLLPQWAQGDSPTPLPIEPEAPPRDGGVNSNQAGTESPAEQGDGDIPAAGEPSPALPPVRGPWFLARRAMSSVARGGGDTRRLGIAARRYLTAKGGARKAATASAAGRVSTTGLGAFLSGVAAGGFAAAAQSLGLNAVIGQRAESVLAAVIDAIAPAGTTDDAAIARRAATETLRELFEKYGVQQGGVEALNAMTASDVAETVELSVAAYVYQRWLFDLSVKIEEHAVTEAEAVRLERDVKAYVKGLVKLRLDGRQAVALGWKGAECSSFVKGIYEAAYRLLGGGA
ncbi:MAG TPA: Qat anti-phage system associated protein QatB [Bryobacteraceae bacterium]